MIYANVYFRALVAVMNSCACLCVCKDGSDHPRNFLVIGSARLFTLMSSFPEHALTQKEGNVASRGD